MDNHMINLKDRMRDLESKSHELRAEMRAYEDNYQRQCIAASAPSYVNAPFPPCTDAQIDALCDQEMSA